MRQTEKMRAAMQATRMRELRALGLKSDFFKSKYRGGKCGLSGLNIPVGELVAYYREHGLCLAAPINADIQRRKDAEAPRCSCGAIVRDNTRAGVCNRCDFICEFIFDELAEDVTRDSRPKP